MFSEQVRLFGLALGTAANYRRLARHRSELHAAPPDVHDPASATVGAPIDLVRWRFNEPGTPRELLLSADSSLNDFKLMNAFDDEVVWATANGDVWSCLASDCAATKRQLGVNAYVEQSVNSGPFVVADDQYLY